VIETLKKGVLRYRTPLKKLTSGLPKGSPSRPRSCLNANQQSDSFTSLEIAPRNSNHIPGGTSHSVRNDSLMAKPIILADSILDALMGQYAFT
jgi:hypothetical protein